MKISFAILGIFFVLAQHSFAQNSRPCLRCNELNITTAKKTKNPQINYKIKQQIEHSDASKMLDGLLKISMLPEGYIFRKNVESIFDTKLKYFGYKKNDKWNPGIRYGIPFDSGKGWGLLIAERPDGDSFFLIHFQRDPDEQVPELCIAEDKIKPLLSQAGWILSGKNPGLHGERQAVYDYVKGENGSSNLIFSGAQPSCLLRYIIISKKIAINSTHAIQKP